MNKKLIAMAVTAAFTAPTAIAEIKMYGSIHMDIRHTDNESTQENVTVNNADTFIGIKGAEDLGNGLKAIFKYQTQYSGVDSNTSFAGAEDSYVGLNGDFGTFILGRHNTPAKIAFYAAGNDHLDSSIVDLNSIGFTETRVNNAIAYISPAISGVQLAAAAVPGEETGASSDTDDNSLADSHSIALMYNGHGIKAGVGYQRVADTLATGGTGIDYNPDLKTYQLGASYTFDHFTIGGQYGKDDNCGALTGTACSANTDGGERTASAISGKYQFGNNAVIANYGMTKLEDATGATVNGTDVDHAGVAFSHSMSKRTSVYVAFKNEDADNGTDTDSYAVGMVHQF